MHNFQQLFKDGDEEELNFLRVLPPLLASSLRSSIYSALLIFNEVSPSSHASDFLSSSLAPFLVSSHVPSHPLLLLH